jgi:LCP family protein required for cell wall assembly
MTILLVGVDFIAGRNHALTDTLMLVSVDLKSGVVSMVSVPRDTAAFPFYWGGEAPVTFKINSLSKAIAAGYFGSPDSPMVTLANEIGYLVGVPVDYYAAIDMGGFVQLIDLVGGVDVNNPRVLNDPFTCTYVPKGLVHMDGAAALRYARSRESTNDYYRAGRQQLVMMALRQKLATPAILPQLGSLMDIAGRSIATNFPLKDAKNYVSAAENVKKISNCVLGPPYNYHPSSSETKGSWTSRLKLDKVANLSVSLFGTDSRYYGQPGVVPTPCESRY